MPEATLDKKDKRIIYELYKNAREPTTKIAKAVGISREVVNYRIRELEKRKIIEGYYTILDFYKLGYVIYRIMMKFSSISPENEKQIIEELKCLTQLAWIAQLKGPWDLVLLIQAKSIHDFKRVYDVVISKYSAIIVKRSTPIVLSIHHHIPNIITETEDYDILTVGGEISEIKLDQIDIKILEELSNNARIPFIDI